MPTPRLLVALLLTTVFAVHELAAQAARQTHAIIPAPASIDLTGERFAIGAGTTVVMDQNASEEVARIGRQLTDMLGLTARRDARRLAAGESPPAGSVHLRLSPGTAALGPKDTSLRSARIASR